MSYLILGFFTGLSLILAIGAQNIFVIEQGLRKQYVFLVCLICSLSDLILIFLGIFLFEYFRSLFTYKIELIFNILLFVFLVYFVINKIRTKYDSFDINTEKQDISFKNVIIKTLGFTYLNPHVYSDTVFFLGNFSKNFLIIQKYYFGIGASAASFLFFPADSELIIVTPASLARRVSFPGFISGFHFRVSFQVSFPGFIPDFIPVQWLLC